MSERGVYEKSRAGVSGGAVVDHEFSGVRGETGLDARLLRSAPIGLPELSEIEVVRHFTALSHESHGVDNGAYPLGSCTMKYNPKRNDAAAQLDGFRHVHPRQPVDGLKGLWRLYHDLQQMICEITGMDEASLAPAAGAHGELAGLFMIAAHFREAGENRPTILIPDSAHGTNPASASMAGFKCRLIPTNSEGFLDVTALDGLLDGSVAALMMTNPSTFGLFEVNILEIAEKVHANGSLLYYDGANLNALMGIVRPGDMGFDVVHINTHKTLSTPHGGGGPGSGPVAVKKRLAPFLPYPVVVKTADGPLPRPLERPSIGRIKSHFGHVAVLVRAYSYILSMGAAGLKQASENAVLNANYMQARLRDMLPPVFDRLCMHETLLSGEKLLTDAINFAKRLIDYDIHPPTMVGAGCVYFPGDLKAAMLIEPTETETLESLEEMIAAFRRVYDECREERALVEAAPYSRAVSRIETKSDCNRDD